MNTQAGTMLHPAAAPRNALSMTPNLAVGRHGLLRSLASDAALGPSTTWVPLSDRHQPSLTNGNTTASIPQIR